MRCGTAHGCAAYTIIREIPDNCIIRRTDYWVYVNGLFSDLRSGAGDTDFIRSLPDTCIRKDAGSGESASEAGLFEFVNPFYTRSSFLQPE